MKDPRYAWFKAPVIRAIANGTYVFSNRLDAVDRLENICDNFTVSRSSIEYGDKILIWIKSFDVSPQQRAEGYTGNFALLSIVEDDAELYSIVMEKLEKPLHSHPERRPSRQISPNWGHRILRRVKSGRPYDSLEHARQDLTQLGLEYPRTAVRYGDNEMKLLIYEGDKESNTSGVKDYYVRIVDRDGGYVMIASRDPKIEHFRSVRIDDWMDVANWYRFE